MHVLLRILVPVLALGVWPCLAAVPIIFDTDMGNDIDDALALAVIHALESRGEARLLAVTLTKDNPYASVYVDLANHFYGRGSIPIGVVRGGKTPEDSAMIRVPAERKRPDGTPLYPRRLSSGRDAQEAAGLLREVLAAQADGSVVMVQVGFSTNLARLLETPGDRHSPLGGRELVARKVRLLSVMAGQFPGGRPEYNVKIDLPASTRLFADWPSPVVASGFEIGETILYPAGSIENDFRYVEHHPVVDAYRNYMKMPYDRPTWDLTAVLYAVRGDRDYFTLSEPGSIRVDAEGRTRLEADPAGRHRYLLVDDIRRARVLEALVQLASQPPSGKPSN